MIHLLLYFIGLAIVGLWVRRDQKAEVPRLILLWWIGLLMTRVAPMLLATFLPSSGILRVVPVMFGWAGAIFLIRALTGLIAWERPQTRRTRIFFAGYIIALVLSGLSASRSIGLALIPAIPMLWTARWRNGRGAGLLAIISFTGFCSIVLTAMSIGADSTLRQDPNLSGLTRLWNLSNRFALLYGAILMGAAATRIHLSIRRIGRRLFVSHLMSGLVPLALAVVFLLLASALFLSTYRGLIAQRLLADTSKGAQRRIAGDLSESGDLHSPPFGEESAGQILLSRLPDGTIQEEGGVLAVPAAAVLAEDTPSDSALLLWDGQRLFLRARVDTVLSGRSIRVEALVPVDSLRMVGLSRIVGTPVRINPLTHVVRQQGGVSIGPTAQLDSLESQAEGAAVKKSGRFESNVEFDVDRDESDDSPGLTEDSEEADLEAVGRASSIGPPRPKGTDLPGGAIVTCLSWSATGFRQVSIPVSSSSRIGEPLLALFSIARENPLAIVVLIVLGLIALFFLVAIWVTISMVTSMGRTITKTVRALTDATAALRGGNLHHRIAIEADDELWRVASNFNDMAEGLERMRQMELEGQRLEEELRLARAIQDRLLPAEPPALERVELAGVSLPAREIGGDYYDYIVLDGGLIGITVADVSGKGTPAALLMSTFRASLRSQDLAQLGPAEVLGRVNRFIHSSVDPGKFITAFLCLFNPATGELRYANAGHDPPMLLHKDGRIEELTGGGLILGMLPQIVYEEARAVVPPESLLAIFTDGVTEARDPEGGFFGPESLEKVLRATRGASCVDVLRRVVDEIQAFASDCPQSDDITLVLARRR